jgi:hypothetical protein
MKWEHYRNLGNRPPTPSKGRGPVQVRIRRAFIASGAEVLSSSAIYDWTHSRRRQMRRKKLPFGVYWRTLKTLRAMCDPVERVAAAWGAAVAIAQHRGRLIAVWKNPRKNEFHDFNKTGLFRARLPVWRSMNLFLIRWLMRKHKRLAGRKTRAAEMLKRLSQSQPGAFIHWSLGILS